MPLVIGIAGKKRSGKDTVAAKLIETAHMFGIKATRRAMADLLKEECAQMVSVESGRDFKEVLSEMHGDGPSKEQYRLLLQFWGTELRRNMCGQDYWVRRMKLWIEQNCQEPEQQIVVIPDIRFPNETQLVTQLSGHNFIVYRPGTDTSDAHVSETALDEYNEWMGVFMNDQGLTELEKVVRVTLVDLIDRTWGPLGAKGNTPC